MTIKGTKGDDVLTGTIDADTIKGGKGRDIIDGRGGDDALKGGKGADIFVLSTDYDGVANISDFKPGVDKIVVDVNPVFDGGFREAYLTQYGVFEREWTIGDPEVQDDDTAEVGQLAVFENRPTGSWYEGDLITV